MIRLYEETIPLWNILDTSVVYAQDLIDFKRMPQSCNGITYLCKVCTSILMWRYKLSCFATVPVIMGSRPDADIHNYALCVVGN